MSNVCYLAIIFIFLVVTARYCSLPGSYCSLLVVTDRYHSLLLVPTFSMKDSSLFQSERNYLTIQEKIIYTTATNTVSLLRTFVVQHYSFVSNCKGGGRGQIADFGKKNPSSSFNYYKRMTQTQKTPPPILRIS